MKRGQLEYATRTALTQFDEWNETTGFVTKFTGYHSEITSIIEAAVKIGALVALEIPFTINEDGEPIQDK